MAYKNSNKADSKRIKVPLKSLLVVSLFVLSGLILAATMEENTNKTSAIKSAKTERDLPEITSVVSLSLVDGIKAKRIYAAIKDDKNEKLFLTDSGIISGTLFDKLNENSKIGLKEFRNIAFESTNEGSGLWVSSALGAHFISIPVNENSKVETYDISNSKILSNNVFSVATGGNKLRWFATDKGFSAISDKKWLTADYQIFYPESLFEDYRITAMATSLNGDTLYAATEGVGVSRVFRNKVDAISGASQYAQWGPIEMPSDSVYSLCITNDGTQWIGTSQGIGRHSGYNSLTNWTVFNTKNGLVNNSVQAITCDSNGNIWCGTKGGISVFNGSAWVSFTMKDGLISNNILCILSDINGTMYLGTDNGIMVYYKGVLTCYQ